MYGFQFLRFENSRTYSHKELIYINYVLWINNPVMFRIHTEYFNILKKNWYISGHFQDLKPKDYGGFKCCRLKINSKKVGEWSSLLMSISPILFKRLLFKCIMSTYDFNFILPVKSDQWFSKVHIFWEGHKILRNLPLTFDRMYYVVKS